MLVLATGCDAKGSSDSSAVCDAGDGASESGERDGRPMSRALRRLGLDFGFETPFEVDFGLVVVVEVSDLRGRPRGLEVEVVLPEGRGGLKGLGGISVYLRE